MNLQISVFSVVPDGTIKKIKPNSIIDVHHQAHKGHNLYSEKKKQIEKVRSKKQGALILLLKARKETYRLTTLVVVHTS